MSQRNPQKNTRLTVGFMWNIMANLWPKFVDIQDHPKALLAQHSSKKVADLQQTMSIFPWFSDVVLSREWGNGMIVVTCCYYGSFPYSLVSKFCEDAFRTIPSSWPKKSWRWWVSLPATSGSNWKPPVGCGTSWMTLERRWEDDPKMVG